MILVNDAQGEEMFSESPCVSSNLLIQVPRGASKGTVVGLGYGLGSADDLMNFIVLVSASGEPDHFCRLLLKMYAAFKYVPLQSIVDTPMEDIDLDSLATVVLPKTVYASPALDGTFLGVYVDGDVRGLRDALHMLAQDKSAAVIRLLLNSVKQVGAEDEFSSLIPRILGTIGPDSEVVAETAEEWGMSEEQVTAMLSDTSSMDSEKVRERLFGERKGLKPLVVPEAEVLDADLDWD